MIIIKTSIKKTISKYLFFSIFFIIIIILENKGPYFLQDDNYAQFFPVLNSSLDFFYTKHQIPWYSFFHGNGLPVIEALQYSLFDPIMHIAYLVCILFLNKYYLIDVYVILYLFITYLVILKTLSYNIFGSFFAILFLFSGHVLITLRSWYYFAPYILMLSLIFHFFKNKTLNASIKNFYSFSLFITFFLFLGNIQYFLYCYLVYFIFLIYIYYVEYRGAKKVIKIFINILPCLLIVLFYFIFYLNNPQRSIDRPFVYGGIRTSSIKPMFIPFSSSSYPWFSLPSGKNQVWAYFFIGTYAYVSLIFFFNYLKKAKKIHKLYILISIIFLILCSPLFNLFKYVPLLNSFRVALKFYFIFLFFISIVGYYIIVGSSSLLLKSVFVFFSSVILFYNIFILDNAFFVYRYSPFDPYQENKFKKINKQLSNFTKMYTISNNRETDPLFSCSSALNFGLIHKIPTANAYEPMSNFKKDILNDLKNNYVSHVLVYNDLKSKIYDIKDDLKEEYREKTFSIYNVRSRNNTIKSINYNFNTIDIELYKNINIKGLILPFNYNKKIKCLVNSTYVDLIASNDFLMVNKSIITNKIILNYNPF